MNDHILKWGPFLDRAIRKWAVQCPREFRGDLKNDCYVKLIQDKKLEARLQALQGKTAINRYMAKTAKNLVCGMYADTPEERVEWVPLTDVDHHKKVELNTDFMEMLSSLSTNERTILTMSYRDRASETDIAHAFGKTRHWVRTTMSGAIQKLRDQEGVGATTNT